MLREFDPFALLAITITDVYTKTFIFGWFEVLKRKGRGSNWNYLLFQENRRVSNLPVCAVIIEIGL